jgi:hypothetical protein
MNLRRLTGWPLKQRGLPYHAVGCIVHHGKFWPPMSALCQKQTFTKKTGAVHPWFDRSEHWHHSRAGSFAASAVMGNVVHAVLRPPVPDV